MAQLLSALPIGAKVKDSGTSYLGKQVIFQLVQKVIVVILAVQIHCYLKRSL